MKMSNVDTKVKCRYTFMPRYLSLDYNERIVYFVSFLLSFFLSFFLACIPCTNTIPLIIVYLFFHNKGMHAGVVCLHTYIRTYVHIRTVYIYEHTMLIIPY